MKKSLLIITLGLVAIMLIVGYAYVRGRAARETPVQPGLALPTDDAGDDRGDDTDAGPAMPGTLNVQHRYLNGMHSYTGTLETPTPCHQVAVDARVMESYPEQIVLSFTVDAPTADMICVQVIADQPFSVRVQASAEATVRGEINGKPVALEIIEQGVGFEPPPLGVELVP